MPRLHPFVRVLVNEARRLQLSYTQFNEYAKQARKHLGLKPARGPQALPHLLSKASLARFYEAIDAAQNVKHQIMLRLLFFTALRVAELCRIEIADVDLAANKIFINQGKGSKDRYVLFPDSFSLTLQTYIAGKERNRYLFETRLHTHYSPRMVQKIVARYAEKAQLEVRVHPHLLRHQMLTFLTAEGKLTDAQIQLISGHASKKSLEQYQHVGLGDVAEDYQAAVRKVNI